MIFMDRNCILIEIFQCLQLVSVGLLLTTCVCFEPEPARVGGGGVPRDNDVST